MEYLRGNATASATGLFVICRHLSAHPDGRTEEELRADLEVLRSVQGDDERGGSVLSSSLVVGDAIGVVRREGSAAPWRLEPSMSQQLATDNGGWEGFRGELLYRMTEQGLAQAQTTGDAPDLIRGLTWLMQLSPLKPVGLSWEEGPYRLVKDLNFDAIERSDQWRPFRRWAVALGMAQASDTAKVLIPDASTAIADQLPFLPRAAGAVEWLNALHSRLPVLGSRSMLDQLPSGGVEWTPFPPGLVLGLLKLESAGVLSLEPSDDASDVIAMGLGSNTRQVGRIEVKGL